MSYLTKFSDMIKGTGYNPATRQYFKVDLTPETPSNVSGNRPGVASFFFAKRLSDPDHLHLLAQSVNLPNFTLDEERSITIKNNRGAFPIPGEGLSLPENNKVTISFLETEIPIIETFFIPWMEHITKVSKQSSRSRNSNESLYYPFLKSKIDVILLKSDQSGNESTTDEILRYRLHGAYPTFIALPDLNHTMATAIPLREVTFAFTKTTVEFPDKKPVYELGAYTGADVRSGVNMSA